MKTNTRGSVLFAFVAANVIAMACTQNQCSLGGMCVSIYECPPLLSLLTSKFLTQSIVNTLRQAQCTPATSHSQSSSFVCCDVFPTPPATAAISRHDQIRPSQSSSPSYGQGAIMPTECGVESTTRKIIGGVGVELDEFPWMAILEYERRKLPSSWISYRRIA